MKKIFLLLGLVVSFAANAEIIKQTKTVAWHLHKGISFKHLIFNIL